MTAPATVRVALPTHLRDLARVGAEVVLTVEGDTPTVRGVLDALEGRHPQLRGTIRDHGGEGRRPFVRFFACRRDLSHDPLDTPLPGPVARGEEPFLVVGAMAGG